MYRNQRHSRLNQRDLFQNQTSQVVHAHAMGHGRIPHSGNIGRQCVHIIGATMGLVTSQIWVGLNDLAIVLSVWSVCIIGIAIAVAVGKPGNFKTRLHRTHLLFWSEVSSLVTTYTTILLTPGI